METRSYSNFQVLWRILRETPNVIPVLSGILVLLIAASFNGSLMGMTVRAALEALERHQPDGFGRAVVYGALAVGYSAVTWALYEWLHEIQDAVILRYMRARLFQKLHKLSYRFFQKHGAELLSVVNNDLPRTPEVVGTMIWFVMNPIWFIVAVVVLANHNFKASLASMIAAPIVAGIAWYVFPKIVKQQERIKDNVRDTTVLVREVVRDPDVVKAYLLEQLMEEKFHSLVQKKTHLGIRTAFLEQGSKLAFTIVAKLALVISIVVAGLEYIAGTGSIGDIGMVVVLVTNAVAVMSVPPMNFLWFTSCAYSAKRVMSVLDEEEVTPDSFSPSTAPVADRGQPVVDLQQVVFSYGEEAGKVGPLSLRLEPGRLYALVGPSGAGKSTLFNLMTGMLRPDRGKVLVLGEPPSDLSREELATRISVVTQSPTLFTGTVRENMILDRPGITEERMEWAAGLAGADEFVRQLPQGYDTLLGTGGIVLSGGQQQRLAVARALVQDTPLLFLDEATAALDTANESLMVRTLQALKKRKTILVIAHRPATVMIADHVFVMEGGVIVREGPPEQVYGAAVASQGPALASMVGGAD